MNRFVRVIVLVMIAAACILVTTSTTPSFAAQGDILLNKLLGSPYSYGAAPISNGDGTITIRGCNSSLVGELATLNSNGEKLAKSSNASPDYIDVCPTDVPNVGGIDGAYFYAGIIPGGSSTHHFLGMFKNGVAVKKDFSRGSSCSSSPYSKVTKMRLGADGNLYAIISNQSSLCTTANELVSMDGRTGDIRFALPLTTRSVASSQKGADLGVYDDGVVVLDQDVDSSGSDFLYYYDYVGAKNDSLSCGIQSSTDPCGFSVAASNDNPGSIYVNEDGLTLINTAQFVNIGGCAYAKRVHRRDLTGTSTLMTQPTAGTSCSKNAIGIQSDGSVVYGESSNVYVASASGTLLYGVPASTGIKSGYTLRAMNAITFDNSGRPIYSFVASPNGYSDKFVYVQRLNSDSTWTTLFSSESMGSPTATDNFSFSYNSGTAAYPAMVNNAIWISFCSTACNAGTESARLLKIDSPGMGFDYPRSAMIDEYNTVHGEQRNYVAIGDSFSSGEGNPTFINGTEATGTNQCHRSSVAYPMLLDQDPDLNLNLQNFRACSGATTQTLVNGQSWPPGGTATTSSQLEFVSADTDVVTLTIGGNDIEFESFVRTCLTPMTSGCNVNSIAYSSSMNLIDQLLPSRLDGLFDDITDALTPSNTTADVYVVGYPFVIREHLAPCEYTLIGTDEQQAAESLTIALDQAIDDAVAAYGDSRIHYVPAVISGNAFTDHDMCSVYPFFNGYDSTHEVYTAHPNASGHQAYASVIKEIMQD